MARTAEDATTVSWSRVHAFRLRRHHLSRRASRSQIVDVVRDVSGVQAQVFSAAALALRARVRGLTMEDVERALWRDRSLVKAWSMRGALHLLPSEDFLRYSRGLAGRAARWMGWMARRGLTEPEADALVAAIVEALRDGPLTRRDLAKRVVESLGERGRRWVEHSWGGIVQRATFFGHVVFGPSKGNEITFALREAWLPGLRDTSSDEAEAFLLRAYLRCFGPASAQDFAAWSGSTVPDATRIFERLEHAVAPIAIDRRTGWILREDLRALRTARLTSPVVRLLPSFDEYLLAHARKDHLVDDAHYTRVYRKAGWLTPVVLVDGRVAGLWSYERKRSGIAVRVEPFTRFSREIREGVEAEVDDVGRFLEGSAAPT